MYHIKNFKIVRRKIDGKEDSGASTEGVKKLCFQQIYKTDSTNEQNDNLRLTELENSLIELNNRMKAIELENNKIKQQLIEIINAINSN